MITLFVHNILCYYLFGLIYERTEKYSNKFDSDGIHNAKQREYNEKMENGKFFVECYLYTCTIFY